MNLTARVPKGISHLCNRTSTSRYPFGRRSPLDRRWAASADADRPITWQVWMNLSRCPVSNSETSVPQTFLVGPALISTWTWDVRAAPKGTFANGALPLGTHNGETRICLPTRGTCRDRRFGIALEKPVRIHRPMILKAIKSWF